MRDDIVSKQNLIDSLLEHNSTLLNHQCCRVIQDTQSNVRSGINIDVTDNHFNNHEINTNTNGKTNIQTTYRKNNKTTVHRDNDDSNLIKQQSTDSSAVKKDVFIKGDSMIKYVNG